MEEELARSYSNEERHELVEEEEEDELYYLESQQPIRDFYDDEEEEIATTEDTTDESFYLANKTFYTTCHKISRQNSPSYRKKPPYSLLENWLIHSVFSKSQQILLRFPVIHPRVMMAEGDFIYTPHQMATSNTTTATTDQDYYYQEEEEEDDDDYDYYDDTFIIGDEGVMVMSASAPDASHFMAQEEDEDMEQQSMMMMDENMWMGHSRYNNTNMTLHVVNPDINNEEDPMYHTAFKPTNNHFQGQLQMVKEEEEEEEEEEDEIKPLSMSPEVIEWYRSADLKKPILEEDEEDCESSHMNNNEDHHSETSASTTRTETIHSDEKSITQHSNESYQSLADIIMMEEETSRLNSYGTLDRSQQQEVATTTTTSSSLLQVSACFVDAAWVALDLAHSYVEENDKRSLYGFLTSMFRIWKVLFLGAETMLGWGSHRLRPQAVV